MTPNHEELVIKSIEKWVVRAGRTVGLNIIFVTDQPVLDRLLDVERALKEISYNMIAQDLNEEIEEE